MSQHVQQYVKDRAVAHWALSRVPVVAMDVIAGSKRAELLDRISQEIELLDRADALGLLVKLRDARTMDTSTSAAIVFSISDMTWFAGIVDGIARELTGWIEVSSTGYDGERLLNLPRYRRMLGINQCASSLSRSAIETDEQWQSRRVQWLGNYHPEVRILHASGRWVNGKRTELTMGTVDSFRAQEHPVEADLLALSGVRMPDGSEFAFVEVYMKPLVKGVLARVRQVAGEPRGLGIMKLSRYDVEVVA